MMTLLTLQKQGSRLAHLWVGGFCLLIMFTGIIAELPGENEEETPQVQKIRVVAERFNFTPSMIKVKKGTQLEMELVSEDTFHGFRLPAADLNATIPARGRGTVTILFNAGKKGEYPFECSRPCGAGHTMMRGVIVVE
jgi:cytochrome c oxidase subunit II